MIRAGLPYDRTNRNTARISTGCISARPRSPIRSRSRCATRGSKRRSAVCRRRSRITRGCSSRACGRLRRRWKPATISARTALRSPTSRSATRSCSPKRSACGNICPMPFARTGTASASAPASSARARRKQALRQPLLSCPRAVPERRRAGALVSGQTRRRRIAAKPSMPTPRRAIEAGSGTCAVVLVKTKLSSS